MTAPIHEVHVERLIGRVVRDVRGERVGRIHEMIVEMIEDHHCVTEFRIGTGAMLERVAAFVTDLPLISRIPYSPKEYRISWRDLDLSDPLRPRLQQAKSALSHSRRDDPG